MKKMLILPVALIALTGGGWVANDRLSFDRNGWLADYEQLKTAVESSYANLRWSRTSKNVDLVTLDAEAIRKLHQASSNSSARAALMSFVAGFNDAHFHIERNPPRPIAALMALFDRENNIAVDFSMDAGAVCDALGFTQKDHNLAVEGAEILDDATFAAGMVTTPGKRRFGIIRIPLFQQREYGAHCESAWPKYKSGKTGNCDEDCQYEFGVRVKHEVAQALADDARALVAAGAESVIIDLTGNGGGTEWAEFAANALAPQPLPAPRVALIRAITDSASVSCNLRGIWQDRGYQPSCWNVVEAPAEPQEVEHYTRPYNGKLYIMTDANTASASEQFAAMLQDGGVARTIGQKTMGIGCGFVDGGNPVVLRHSRQVVWMPNCARFRADGSNEFEGVTPDYVADWGVDASSRTATLLDVLDKLPR